jgi:hypothetical protein
VGKTPGTVEIKGAWIGPENKNVGLRLDGADFPMIARKAELAFGNGHYYS